MSGRGWDHEGATRDHGRPVDEDRFGGESHPIDDALPCLVLANYHEDGVRGTLSLSKGDIVYVLERDESGWWGGHKEGDEVTGWIPSGILQPVGGEGDDYEYARTLGPSSPVTTSDGRIIASPQASRRQAPSCSASSADQSQAHRQLEDLAREKQRAQQREIMEIEEARDMERSKYAEELRRLEAEISRIRIERDTEKEEREKDRREQERREREKEKQDRERQRQEAQEREREKQAWEQEAARRTLESNLVLEERIKELELEVATLRSKGDRKVEQGNIQTGITEATSNRSDVTGSASTNAPKAEGGLGSNLLPFPRTAVEVSSVAGQGSPEVDVSRDERRPFPPEASRMPAGVGAGGREDSSSRCASGRGPSSGVQRRLFAPPGTEPSHSHATSMSGMPSTAQAGATGPAVASTAAVACGASSAQLAAQHQLPNARIVSVPPRPSPRAVSAQPSGSSLQAVAVPGWRSASTCASPRGKGGRVHCEVATPTAATANDRPCAVSALVREFERRSTSQTPGSTTRTVDPSPSRPITMAASSAARAPSSSSGRAAHSAASNPMPAQEVLSRGRVAEPDAEPTHAAGVREYSHGGHHMPMRDHQFARSEDQQARMRTEPLDPSSSPPAVLGMSPLTRPRERATLRGIATPSPTPKGSSGTPKGPSVQERIRRLYGN